VAVGATPRGTCGRSIAAGRPPPTAAATALASAVRIQAPASDERSETCRRRRRGGESVRHGWRSEKASGTLACIWVSQKHQCATYLFYIHALSVSGADNRWVGARRVTLRHVSSRPPFRTVLEAFTSYGSALSDQSWS